MVASDTVVGLVGAGILLVALVGVFVYESQNAGSDEDLKDAIYATALSGTIDSQAGSGQQVMGQCVGAPGSCVIARTTIDASFAGLPRPGNLHYVVFLEGGGQTVAVGEATASGANYATGTKQVSGDHTAKKNIVLSLEPNAGATTPTMKIATWTYQSNGALSGNRDARFVNSGGNHTLSFAPSGSSTTVEATLDQLPTKASFTYRGWMVKDNETAISYVFVGNFTADEGANGSTVSGTIRGNVPGAKADYIRFIVTFESSQAAIGLQPAGPAVVVSEYGLPAGPTIAK